MKNKLLIMMGIVFLLGITLTGCGGGKDNITTTSNDVSSLQELNTDNNYDELDTDSNVDELNKSKEKIIIASDPWPPYVGKEDGELGSMVEIALKAFEKVGIEVEYKNLPWDRAIQEVRSGNINGIIASVYDVEDLIVGEYSVGISGVSLFVKKGNEFEFESIDSLKDIRLAGMMNYSYGYGIEMLLQEATENKNPNVTVVQGDNPIKSMVEMLANDRIDVMPEDRDVFFRIVNDLGLNSEDYSEIELPDSYDESYISFSPNIEESSEYAMKLDEGINIIRTSGELQQILNKYNLEDWYEE